MTPVERRTVLVTGGSGFLGRHCLPLLVDAFDEVHATSTQMAPIAQPGIQWHTVDLRHSSGVSELIATVRPTHLLHLAWFTEHGRFWNSPENTRWLSASVDLVRAFRLWGGRRVVTAGSCAEYDWLPGHRHEMTTKLAPATLYGACKHALRLVVESVDGLSVAHTRIFHLFGPYEDPRRLTPSVIQSLLAGGRAACTQGDQVRDFLYVKDAAAAHVRLLLSNVEGPVNVASGAPTTIREFVTGIGQSLRCEDRIDFGKLPQRPNEPAVLTADIARLRNEVGYSPATNRSDALRETIAWYQKGSSSLLVRESEKRNSSPQSRNECPLCSSSATTEFLRRENVPVHQNLTMPSRESARAIARGTLAMHVCDRCGFVFNAAFDPSLLAYGDQYDNSQTCSPAFSRYVDGLVHHLIEERGLRGKQIVEVGCGKGEFLRRLLTAAPDARGWGFDPTYVGSEETMAGRLRFRRTFYDASCSHISADAVVCRHVIEHVQDPNTLLRAVRDAINAQPDAQVFFETPCVDWIFHNQVVWDLFYEHCSLFTAASLRQAFVQNGFDVTEWRHVFGGQYLWLEARSANAKPRPLVAPARPTVAALWKATAYGNAERELIARWRNELDQYTRRGSVCVWGAGAKGVTFANLVDPQGEQLDSVVDLNPAKQGKFLPGTGHPIVSPAQLTSRNISTALVLNPNYTAEIRQSLADIAPRIEVVDLSQPSSESRRAA